VDWREIVTAKEVMNAVQHEGGRVRGICIRFRWTWIITVNGNEEYVTRAVNSLLKQGKLKGAYYSGGVASASLVHLSTIAPADVRDLIQDTPIGDFRVRGGGR
jgi:hypothetical protein